MPELSSGHAIYGLAIALLIAGHAPAKALDIGVSGGAVTLSGPIRSGDDIKFREATRGVNLRLVTLNSGGGQIGAAREIARAIRAAGAATLVDASRATCASACTVLFAGGAQRHYVNAGGIADHLGPFREHGLGYHEGNNWGPGGRKTQSGQASANMVAAFYELGVGAAGDLVTRSDWRHLYYISGATARSLGIATSLSRP